MRQIQRTPRGILYGVGACGILFLLGVAVAGRRSLPALFPDRPAAKPSVYDTAGDPPAPVGQNRAGARPPVKLSIPEDVKLPTFRPVTEPDPMVRGDNRFRKTYTSDGLKLKSPYGEIEVVLKDVRFGSRSLPIGSLVSKVPAREGRFDDSEVVEYARGAVVERYISKGFSVEQVFELGPSLESMKGDGDLTLTVGFVTDLTPVHQVKGSETSPENPADLVEFRRENGTPAFTYGGALAIDAAGRKQALRYSLRGGSIEMTLDAAFVARAAFPLTIDPLVGTTVYIDTSGSTFDRKPDIAFHPGPGIFLCVYERAVSGVDGNIYCRTIQTDGTVSGQAVIEGSTLDSRNPKVARAPSGQFCVVWQERGVSGVGKWGVYSMMVGLSGTNPSPSGTKNFVPSSALFDSTNPDVGFNTTTAENLVVWEWAASGTDHDIRSRIIHSDGTNGAEIVVDQSGNWEETPTVTPIWSNPIGVCYVKRINQSSQGDIWAASVNMNVPGISGGPVTISSNAKNEYTPELGSTQNASFPYLIWNIDYSATDLDTYGCRMQFPLGAAPTPGIVFAVDGATYSTFEPHLACGKSGTNERIIFTYTKNPANPPTTNQNDILAIVADTTTDPPTIVENLTISSIAKDDNNCAVALFPNQLLAMCVWEYSYAVADHDIYGQRVQVGPAPGVTVTPTSGLSTNESGTTTTFTIVLNSQPSADVTIPLASLTPTEGVPLVSSVTFTNANWNVPQTVTVRGINDSVTDGSVLYTIQVGDPSSLDSAYDSLTDADTPDVVITNFDNEPEVSISVTDGIASEPGSDKGTFQVTRTGNVASALTVNFSVAGTATSGVDYTSIGTSVVIPAGAGSQTIQVSPLNDFIAEGPETVIVTLTSGPYTITSGGPATVTINDNETVGVTVSAISGNTTESGGQATFTVVLNSQPAGDVTIPIQSLNTAEGTASPSSLTFTATNWSTLQTVTVTGVNDFVTDGNVSYTIRVGDPSSAVDAAYNNLTDADTPDVTVINLDNEPEVTLTVTDASASEPGPNTGTFTVTRTGSTGAALTVNFSVSGTATNGVDYTAIGTSVTIPAGQASAPVTVQPIDDNVAEGTETVTLQLTSGSYTIVGGGPASVSIADNETVGVTVSTISGPVSENGTSATFTVKLNSQPSANVTIPIASLDTTEGTVSTSLLTFTSANWNILQTVTVTGVNDTITDGNVVFIVQVGDPSSIGDAAYNALTDVDTADVTVTNLDNEPEVNLVVLDGSLGEGGDTATLQFTRTGSTTAALTVNYSVGGNASNGGDYTFLTNSVTIPVGASSVNLVIDPIDDDEAEGDEFVIIGVIAGSYTSVSAGPVTLTLVDNDFAGVVVRDVQGSTSEDGGTAEFYVRLTSKPLKDVTIPIQSLNPAEGITTVNSLTFTSADWDIYQTVTIVGQNDFLTDGTVTYQIQVGDPSSADPFYDALTDADTADPFVDNIDNEPEVTLSVFDGSAAEGGGNTGTFRITRTGDTTSTLLVTYALGGTATNGTDYSTLSGNVTIPFGASFVDVVVSPIDDAIAEGAETVTLQITGGGFFTLVNGGPGTVTITDNDSASVIVNPISGPTSENGTTATFTVKLGSQPTADVTIPIQSLNTAEGTVSTSQLVFTSSNWNTLQTVTVTGVNDSVTDGNQTFTVKVGDPSSADPAYNALTDASTPDVTVINNDNEPELTLTVSDASASEAGLDTGSFTVTRTGSLTGSLVVNYSVAGTATNGTDYLTLSGSVTIPASAASALITVTPIQDFIAEGSETVTVTLTGGGTLVTPGPLSVTIADNDTVGVAVSGISGNTSENGASATFTVVLTSQPSQDVNIPIQSLNTGEGTVSTSNLTFTNANWSTPQTITVTGVNDSVTDGTVAYTVKVGDPSSLDPAYNNLTDADTADVAVFNLDNEPELTLSVADASASEAGLDPGSFTVTRTGLTTGALVVNYTVGGTATNGTDYATLSGSVTIPIGQSSASIVVTPLQDFAAEGPETVTVTLTSGGTIVVPGPLTVTISDNDNAGVTVSGISGNTTEGGGTATFTVVLNSLPLGDVTIPIQSLDTTEGTVSTSSLTFTNANWNVPQTVTVTGVNDALTDGNVVYTIKVGDPSSTLDAAYNALTDADTADVTVTNLDNEPEVSIVVADASASEAGLDPGSFTVSRTGDTTGALVVNYSISGTATNGTDYVALSGQVTIPGGQASAAITVTPIQDAVAEGAETVNVTLAAGSYTITTPGTFGVTIADNDTASVQVSAISGNTNENGTTATFTVVLGSQPTADVTIPIQSLDTTEGTVSVPNLVFTSGNWNVPQTVTVTGVNDSQTDGNITYFVRVGDPSSADPAYNNLTDADTPDVQVTNNDNEPELTLTVPDNTASETLLSTGNFLVTRTGDLTNPLIVSYSVGGTATNGTDYATLNGTVTIPAGSASAPITVTPIDDFLAEGPETVTVTLTGGGTIVAAGPLTVTIADDDNVGVTVSSISGHTTEGGASATFTVVLKSQPTADVTIPIQSLDTTEGTVSTSSLNFTSGNWSTPQTVTVTGVNDALSDGNITYTVMVGDPSSLDPAYNALTDADTPDVTVINDDNEPEITLVATDPTAAEAGLDPGTFTVTRTGDTSGSLVVNYTVGGSATPGSDYTALSGTVTLGIGANFATIPVTPLADALVEGPETVTVTITPSVNYTIVSGGPATVTIADNAVGVTVSAISGNTTESGGTATFTVRLNSAPSADVTIPIQSLDTAEGTVSTGLLTFTSLNWNVLQTVTVTGVNDALTDGNKSYTIRVGDPSSSDLSYNALTDADTPDVTVINVDNEPELTITLADGAAAEAGTDPGSFTVTRTGDTTLPLIVSYTIGGTATNGTDYTTLPGTVTIPAGQASAPITVTPVQDSIAEGAETVIVTLTGGGTLVTPGPLTVTIADDDTASVIVNGGPLTTSENGTTATFTVKLGSQPSADVTIPIQSLDTTEGTVSVPSLTFTNANWNVPQTVTVTGVNDALSDGNITYTVRVGDPSSADPTYNALTDADTPDVTVTNNDNEPELTLAVSDAAASEAGLDTGAFTVTRTGDVSGPLAVTYSISGTATNGTDYVTLTGTLNIPGGSAVGTITVTPIQDALAEAAESVTITLTAGSYTIVSGGPATVMIADDDIVGVTVSAISGNTTESGGTATFTVVLNTQPSADVTIPISSLNTAEGTVSTSSLVFTNANWNTAQTVTVTGVNDTNTDGNQIYTVKVGDPSSLDPAYNALTDADTTDVTITNVDNEPEITIAVTDASAAEAGLDPGVFTVTRTGATTGSLDVTYSLGGTATNTADYATLSGTVTIPVGASSATITVTPVDDAVVDPAETVTVTITASANYTIVSGGPATVTITDNDTAGVLVSAISGNTTEGGGTATFTVRLTSQPLGDVTIPIQSLDTTEGTVSTASLTFTNANWNVMQTVTVTGVNDTLTDGDIAYTIQVGDPSSIADPLYNALTDANTPDVAVINVDNEPEITLTVPDGSASETAGDPGTFTVTRTGLTTGALVVNYSVGGTATNGTDYTTLNGTVTIPAGQASADIVVTPVDDALVEAAETVTVTITAGTYTIASGGPATVTIADNDSAGVQVSAISGNTTEGGGTATFTVRLSSQPLGDVTIPIQSLDTTEGTVSTASLTFTNANWNVMQTVTVTGVNDTLTDGNVSYTIRVGDPSSAADPAYNALTDADTADVTVLNIDNEPELTITLADGAASEAGLDPGSFTVTRTGDLTNPLVVNYSIGGTATNGTDYVTLSGSVTIPATQASAAITVTPIQDAVAEGSETVIVTLTGGGTLITPGPLTVTIADNDNVGVAVSAISGNTTESGGTATFTVVLTSQPSADVTIPISSLNTAEGTVSTSNLTFTNANWSTAQTVTVTGVNDTLSDGNQIYTIKVGDPSSLDPAYNALTDADTTDVTVTNVDNEPEITLAATDASASEPGADTGTFTVTRTGSTAVALVVNVTVGGTATSGVDYTAIGSTVTIPAGASSAPVLVTPLDDAIVEPAETVTLTLAAGAYTIVTAGPATVTISDNDAAGVTVSAISGNTTEGGGTATFTVKLNSQPLGDVTIPIQSMNTAEGTVSTASLTFTNANWNVLQTVTVTGVNDTNTDGDVVYTVKVGDPTSAADPAYEALTDANTPDVTVTNVDNEPEITLAVTDASAAEAGLDPGTFTVTRTGSTAAALTVNFTVGGTATSGVDYVSIGTSVVIPAGQPSAVITVTPIDDAIPDPAETVTVTVAASANYTIVGGGPASVTIADNDVVGVTVSAISGPTTEGGGTATFTVVLNTQPSADVTIPIQSLNTAEGTVSTSSLTFTNGNWNVPQTVTVTGVNDAVSDGNQNYTVKVGDPSSADAAYNALTDADTADVAVTNNDNEPEITLTVADPTASEPGADTGGFLISRTGSTAAPLTVNFTVSGTATGGTDYTAIGTSVIIPAGQASAPVTITPIDDAVAEGSETVILTLAAGAYTLVSPGPGTVTIADNDNVGVLVSAVSGPTSENGATATFTVRLTSQPSADVVIPIQSLNTGEGTVSTSNLTFTNVNWNVQQTVTVTGVNDVVTDGDVPYTVKVGDPSSADPAYDALTDADTTDVNLVNVDNEPEITIVATDASAAEQGADPGVFTITRTGSTAAGLVVNYSIGGTAISGSDYTALPGNVTIPAGQLSATVTVTPIDDSVVESSETVTLTIIAGSYTIVSGGPALVTITDNDASGITVSPTLGLQTTEAGGTATFTVVLNSVPTAPVTIGLSSSNPSEGTISTALLTFTVANAQTPQTVTITGVNDTVADGDQPYTIVLDPAVSADPNYNGTDPADVSVTNRDDDAIGFTITPLTGLMTNEYGKTATFTVVLRSTPSADVTLPLHSSNTAEGTVLPPSLTFTPANALTPQTVTITGVDDGINDGNVAYTIVTDPATSSDTNYNGKDPADVSVLNLDNEQANVTVTPTNGLITTESGGTATFTMVLNTIPTANVTIGVSSNLPSEGTVSTSSITFTPANAQTPQTITVTGVDDALSDGDKTFTIVTAPATSTDPAYSGFNPADVSVTNQDNEPFVPPKITLSALGMAFSASEGGANPASQSMFITNSGNGTLNWSLTDDAPWLTVTPSSGSVDFGVQQFMTVSVDITGLVSGPYVGTITITDPAASNSPQTFVVTLTILPPPPMPTITTPAGNFSTTAVSPALMSGTSTPGATSITWANMTTGVSGVATGTDNWIASVPLIGGDNVIRIYSWNAGGAGSQEVTIQFTTDQVPPVVQITFPTSAPSFTAAATPATIAGSASDNVNVASVTWTNLQTGATGATTGVTSWIASIPLTDGANDIQVTAVDDAGNSSSSVVTISYSTPPDAAPPIVAILVPNSVFFAASTTPLTIAGTAADSVGISRVTWFNQTTGGRGIATGTANWSADVPLAGGNNFISVTAEDPSGNATTASLFVSYHSNGSDTVNPFLSIDSPTTAPILNTSTSTLNLAGAAADDVALNTVVWQNPATGESGTADGLANWKAKMDLKSGANLITMTAYDTSGNKTAKQLAVSYTPPPPPPPPPVHIAAGHCGLLGAEILLPVALIWAARRTTRRRRKEARP